MEYLMITGTCTGMHQVGEPLPWSAEAQAAYYNNYNEGRDGCGRSVLRPAGVEPTPDEAYTLGLAKCQKVRCLHAVGTY